MKLRKSALRTTPLSIIVLAFAAEIAVAQESLPEYEEIFVTAARAEQPVQETLASVTTFTANDIELSQSTDLGDLLAGTAGIDVTDNGGRGAVTSVGIRGFSSDSTLVLVDGVRISSATTGTAAFQNIPVENIERVEIVRGPKSALYGADAIGGVIQIFTKTEIAPYVRLGIGSHETFEAAAGTSYNKDGSNVAIALTLEDSQGFSRIDPPATVFDFFTGEEIPNPSFEANSDDDGFDEIGLSITASQEAGAARVYTNHLLSTGSTEFDSGGDDSTDFFNLASTLGVDIALSTVVNLDINVGYAADESETFSAFSSEFNTNRLSANTKLDYSINDNHLLIFGYDFFDDRVDSTSSFVESSRDNQALYVQYLGDVGDISFQAGLRVDDNEAFDENTTGNLSVGYALTDKITLGVSYGTAFRAPTFNDLFFPETDFSGFIFSGNPELEPEESETIEFLARGAFLAFDWSVSLYQTNADNLIVGSVFVEDLGINTSLNVNEAEVQGAEATIGYEVAGWRADAEITFTSAEDEATGERLPSQPERQAKVSVSKKFGAFDTAISLVAQGDRISAGTELGGYGVVNLRTQYALTENLSISASIRNLFDNEYTLINGFSGPFNTEDRAGSLSATYRF